MNAFTKIIQNLACSLRARPGQRGFTRYLGSLWDERKVLRQHRRQAGLALIEMLVAASLLGTVAITALLGLSTSLMATSNVANGRTAMDIAQSQMESVKSQDFGAYVLWDNLDDETTRGGDAWNALNTQVPKLTEDTADKVEGDASLQIEGNGNSDPGAETDDGLAWNWSAYEDGTLHLYAKADEAGLEVHVKIIDAQDDFVRYDSAALSAADEWEDLEFDFSALPNDSSGTMDWDVVDEVEIYINKDNAPSGFFFHIDNLRLSESSYDGYTKLPTDELHGWNQSDISIDVVPRSLDLQFITVTVTYASGTKTLVLEGYKSSR